MAQAEIIDEADAMDIGEVVQEVIVGGKGVLLQMLLNLIQKAIHAPCELFDKQVKLTEKVKANQEGRQEASPGSDG